MKIQQRTIIILMICAAYAFSACGGSKETNIYQQEEGLNAGDQTFFNADGAGFIMAYVSGKSFKTGTDDLGTTAAVTKDFWIGETEVTYELWYTVLQWATTRLTNPYTFSNAGREGNDGTIGAAPTNMETVTTVNWRDAMVWCNAATEWYNEKNGMSYTCAYYSDSAYATPIRTSTNTTPVNAADGSEDEPYIKAATNGNLDMANCTATGFRLPASNEWELAARYIDDKNNDGDVSDPGEYYPGNYASGAMADYNNAGADLAVAWYSTNSGSSAHAVKGLAANALGLYDMSGNVYEWCFEWCTSGSNRVLRGGSWNNSADFLQVGYVYDDISPYDEYSDIGFRFVKTQ